MDTYELHFLLCSFHAPTFLVLFRAHFGLLPESASLRFDAKWTFNLFYSLRFLTYHQHFSCQSVYFQLIILALHSDHLSYFVREEKVFLSAFRVPGWIWKLNWQKQINRRKTHKLYWIFTCTQESLQENEDLKKWLEKKAFTLVRQRNNTFVKQTSNQTQNNQENTWQTFGLWK